MIFVSARKAMWALASAVVLGSGISACGSNGTPVAPISGAATPTPKPTATATPKPTPTPTLAPTPSPSPSAVALAATGTGALAIEVVAGTVYAFVPTSSISNPTTTDLVQVPVANGTGILSRTRFSYAQRTHRPAAYRTIAHPHTKMFGRPGFRSLPYARVSTGSVNPSIIGTEGVTACSPDQTHLMLYCIDGASATVTVLNASVVPAIIATRFATDATTTLTFSGGSCIVCGIVYDPTDNGVIVATANGFELYGATGTQIETIPADVSETFGYNPVTNQVFNPNYAGNVLFASPSIDVVDIKNKIRYALTPTPGTLSTPDQGGVDSVTNIGLTVEEDSSRGFYVVPIGLGTFSATTNSFTVPNPVTQPFSSGILNFCSETDGFSIDSFIHVVFFNGEFCSQGIFGAAQMPTAPTASPTLTNFAFFPAPNTPDGLSYESGFDPHAQSVVESSIGDFGVQFNGTTTYLGVVDLKKLLVAPRLSSDPTLVDPTYDVIANKVLYYIPI